MTMKKTDVQDLTIRSTDSALEQPVTASAKTQSPSGLVQDTKPESTTLQPGDSMSQGPAIANTNGIALGPRG